MKDIDFLPDVYRQQRTKRRAQRWWCTVTAIFAVAILAATTSQWMIRSGIQHELVQVEPKYAQALARQAELELVRYEIDRAEEQATLYGYLRHPWPRTQILACIVRPLPDSIRLTELTFSYESIPAAPVVVLASPAKANGAKAQPTPTGADLALLRSECDGRQAILSITGTATALADLHAYVDQLGKMPPIVAAHLKGVESVGAGKSGGEAQFHIHVVVRPGYGQPGGPPLPPAEKAPTTEPASDISPSHQLSQVAPTGR